MKEVYSSRVNTYRRLVGLVFLCARHGALGALLVNMAEGVEEGTFGLRAVLIGGTGAIGECLLGELLNSKVCRGNWHVIIIYSMGRKHRSGSIQFGSKPN